MQHGAGDDLRREAGEQRPVQQHIHRAPARGSAAAQGSEAGAIRPDATMQSGAAEIDEIGDRQRHDGDARENVDDPDLRDRQEGLEPVEKTGVRHVDRKAQAGEHAEQQRRGEVSGLAASAAVVGHK